MRVVMVNIAFGSYFQFVFSSLIFLLTLTLLFIQIVRREKFGFQTLFFKQFVLLLIDFFRGFRSTDFIVVMVVMMHDFNDFSRRLIFPFQLAVLRTARPIQLLLRVVKILVLNL